MTSCQLSQPTFETCQTDLGQALASVPEESFFAYTDACDEAGFTEAVHATAPGWLTASVGFTGPFAGRVDLTLPDGLSRELCAALVGADSPDELEASAVVDFAGEFANMVCGCWLSRAYNDATFDLTSPRVAQRSSPGPEPGGSGTLFILINQSPVRLTVTWATSVQ